MGKKRGDFLKNIIGHPIKGVVIEDNIWEYGKEKEKAKVYIMDLTPLQEPPEYIRFEEEKSGRIRDTEMEMTRNYIEMLLPDAVYTYPTEGMVENEEQTLFGATRDHPLNDGTNGAEIEGMVRIVPAGTVLMVLIIDGNVREENIHVLYKQDDYDENSEVHHGETEHTRKAALR